MPSDLFWQNSSGGDTLTTPHTNRGVVTPPNFTEKSTEVSIDWLQYSVPWPTDLHEWPDKEAAEMSIIQRSLPPHDKLFITGEILEPLRGYNRGLGASFGRVFWHDKNKAQHIGVIFTGQDLAAAINVMLPNSTMIDWVLGHAKKVSRLDVAVDIHDEAADPTDILRYWRQGNMETRAREVTETVNYRENDDGTITKAPTVYVGKRASERMLRVYDKGIETRQGGNWVRAELQTRGRNATALAGGLQRGGVVNAGRQAIRNFCDIKRLAWWKRAMMGPAVELDKVPNKETKTEKWILETALPAIQREAMAQLDQNRTTVYDALERVFEEIRAYHKGATE